MQRFFTAFRMTYHMTSVTPGKAKCSNDPHDKYPFVKIVFSADINNSRRQKQYILIKKGKTLLKFIKKSEICS